jgi:hypothetical protein
MSTFASTEAIGATARRPPGNWKAGVIVTLALLLGACGFTAPRGDAGYANLESLGIADTDRTLALSIGPTVLNFAARHAGEDPETQALLRGLDGVRIRIYQIDGDGERVARRIEDMSRRFRDDGWEPVALIRAEGEQTHMLVKTSKDRVQGLVLLASDGAEEVVVINLMGDLQPQYFSDVMVALEVDAPDVEVALAE